MELTEPNLSLGMKWLQGTWIRRYNGLRRLIGRPFQGRYKALLVEPGEALGRVCHYIHLNPVREATERGQAARCYKLRPAEGVRRDTCYGVRGRPIRD